MIGDGSCHLVTNLLTLPIYCERVKAGRHAGELWASRTVWLQWEHLDRFLFNPMCVEGVTPVFRPAFMALIVLPWCVALPARGEGILIEAESFEETGGWVLDTQFIDTMGSPYLLAHGLGKPVADATTSFQAPVAGTYRIHVRTLDWVAKFNASGMPGQFQILIDGKPLNTSFGRQSKTWAWQYGGTIRLTAGQHRLTLRDSTGFDGRCDAIYLSTEIDNQPPNSSTVLSQWRREQLGLAEEPTERGDYDLVVVGGGYSGMGAALSAARMGCRVALIQNRPVLGGNGSSEVRVWAMGLIRRGIYPRIGEIIEEFADQATKSPGLAEEFGDALKEQVIRAEANIDLFLNHHAYQVEMEGDKIKAVVAFDTRTSEYSRFTGRLFADCTGHGTIGYLAEADWDMTPRGRMGMSNMWAWAERDKAVEFPETPWALDLTMKDFPYPRDFHGQWFWESGFDRDPIKDAESIRDWNLRAVYGAFNAMKNRDGRADHLNAELTWVAYIGGPRESRRLMGDIVLTQEDIVSKRVFPDGCVPSTWSIDLHYPKEQYAIKFPENPFISIAEHDRRIDRTYGYPIPYRCFYSRNITNLFMAGRCISVTHEALGTTRVMKTCGMMGEVVGKASSVCVARDCLPRDVYEQYLAEFQGLLQLPGKARRKTVSSPIEMPEKLLIARPEGPPSGRDPESFTGQLLDDRDATQQGSWTEGTGLKGYIGYGYIYAPADSQSQIDFELTTQKKGRYEVLLAYQSHENRGKTVLVTLTTKGKTDERRINMTQKPPIDDGFTSLGVVDLNEGDLCQVRLSTQKAGGYVHADAVWLRPVKD